MPGYSIPKIKLILMKILSQIVENLGKKKGGKICYSQVEASIRPRDTRPSRPARSPPHSVTISMYLNTTWVRVSWAVHRTYESRRIYSDMFSSTRHYSGYTRWIGGRWEGKGGGMKVAPVVRGWDEKPECSGNPGFSRDSLYSSNGYT